MTVTVFSDGGARPNPGPIGSGYYGEDDEGMSHVWWKSFPGNRSNNEAELLAAIATFKDANVKGWKRVILRPDSKYVIALIEHRKRYKETGFKNRDGNELKSLDKVKELFAEIEQFLAEGGVYAVEWVKGHSGVKGNELADQMATRGVIAAQKGVEVEESFSVPTKKYGTYKSADYNRLFSSSHLYFLTPTMQTSNGLYVYHTGHHGKDDDDADKKGKTNTSFGKMLPEAVSCIVLTKTPETTIDKVIEEQFRLTPNQVGIPYVVSLSNLFKPATWHETKEYKGLYLHLDKRKRWLKDTHDIGIVHVHNPPKLGLMAMEKRLNRVDELASFLEGKESIFSAVDITDEVFEKVTKTKGKKEITELSLKLSIQTSGVLVYKHTTTIDGVEVAANVRLNIGHELYPVNAFYALRKENPKVELITWPDGYGMRYAVLFTTDYGYAFREPLISNLILFSTVAEEKLKVKK